MTLIPVKTKDLTNNIAKCPSEVRPIRTWVANFNDGTVIKLRASDGADLGTFNAGTGPDGVAFDGANVWVCSSDCLPDYRSERRFSPHEHPAKEQQAASTS